MRSSRLKTFFFYSIMASVLFAAVAGISVTMQSQTMGMGSMQQSDMGQSCPMTASEHCDWWNAIFSAIQTPGVTLAYLGGIALVFALYAVRIDGRERYVFVSSRERLRVQWSPPIRYLFASGLIHSKLYA